MTKYKLVPVEPTPEPDAEPDVEPVAWAYQWKNGKDRSWTVTTARWPDSDEWYEYPLYTAPQPPGETHPQPAKREPLLADEICDSWEFVTGHQIQFGPSSEGRPMYLSTDEVIEFARAIEAAHGITGDTE